MSTKLSSNCIGRSKCPVFRNSILFHTQDIGDCHFERVGKKRTVCTIIQLLNIKLGDKK